MSLDGVERRLSAILSADVAGYSRLMADDEDATVRTLTAYRELIGAEVRKRRGRVVDAPGDNLLAELPTATDAVEAAIEIQRVVGARNAELPAERRMAFRIGVHLGEVRVEGERLYGDGVNIAARLEGLAEAAGICVSAVVRDQVARRLGLAFNDLGEQPVKNLPDPVHAYRLLGGDAQPAAASRSPDLRHRRRLAAGAFAALAVVAVIAAVAYRATRASGPQASLASSTPPVGALTAIAVLPFDDLSPGGDQQWLASGMAEELIEMLSRTEALQVVARTSAQVAKQRGGDIPAIGKLLNVGSVVEGSVRHAGDDLRVTVQLIRVSDGYHLWSGRYDRRLDDVFAVQTEIGREVSEALRAELGVAMDTHSWLRAARYQPRDVRAYELVKRGVDRFPLAVDEKSIRPMLEDCLEALELDPLYAQAHAELGWAYYALWYYVDHRDETLELATAAARRALELEPTTGSAHNLLGFVSADAGDWRNAKTIYERALEARPGDGALRTGYGLVLASIGSFQESAVQMEKGVALDPLYGIAHRHLGNLEVDRRRYDAAIVALERGAELGDFGALAELPVAYHLAGRDREALEAWVRYAAVRAPGEEYERSLREGFDQNGNRGVIAAVLESITARFGAPCALSASYTARLYAQVGDRDRMFACLEQSLREHKAERFAKVHPIYDPYRDDPRFEAFLERIGLAD
jgi:adenylate cyclase